MANRKAAEERAEIRVRRKDEDREGSGSRPGGEESGEESSGQEPSKWEWIVAAVSTVIVLGAIGIMAYEGFTEPSTPPEIEIVVDSVIDYAGGGYGVVFEARNRGQSTAAGLVVEGELRSDTGTVETAQVTIDYVPAEAMRRGGLFFSHDPRGYALEIRPKGYDVP